MKVSESTVGPWTITLRNWGESPNVDVEIRDNRGVVFGFTVRPRDYDGIGMDVSDPNEWDDDDLMFLDHKGGVRIMTWAQPRSIQVEVPAEADEALMAMLDKHFAEVTA
jgi:hypothetical protein